MLLTTVSVKRNRKQLWFIVSAYLSRWLVEETIRFIKQSYHLEDIRVLNYERLRNLVALVLAAAYFSEAEGLVNKGGKGGEAVLWCSRLSLLCVG